MIGYLKGYILELYSDHILLNVNNVGYKIFLPNRLLATVNKQDELSLYIHTAVKEDDISLFGFLDYEDKHIFLELNKVSGVGAKTALAILGLMRAAEITDAIMFEDKASFTRVSGIGAKAATRIINDLKDKISKLNLAKQDKIIAPNLAAAPSNNNEHNLLRDALSALENLGYQRSNIVNLVKEVVKEEDDLSHVITKTLKKLAK
ncbi:MAG: Holliday junction branch migration protein RuvA [Rickettsiales bacterium]